MVEIGQASGTGNAAGRIRIRSQFWDPGLIASKRETGDRLRQRPEASETEELSTRRRSRQKSHRESRRGTVKDSGKGVKLLFIYLYASRSCISWYVLAIYLGRPCSADGLTVNQSKTTRAHLHHPSLPKADIGWLCLVVTKQLLVFLLGLDESFLE